MDIKKVFGIKRSNSIDYNDHNCNNYKRQKFNNEISQYQVYKMKCSIVHPDSYNLYNNVSDITNYFNNNNYNYHYFKKNSDQILNNCIDNKQVVLPETSNNYIDNEFSNYSSEYEQINITLKNLHEHSQTYKNNQNTDIVNNNGNDNSNSIYTDFYVKINSHLKNIHITNIKQHGKEYLE
ncbi:hypothetical protein BCR36DRAFT_401720 [Piromyces finnis]|uniref:Uncharacterized protein n=1 Tax=Piromyces finnis TaxID=1754191 RepID=A0A1Y1VMT5_9FUNG|nr:hypothetical protein BCR36DRAFT_401720 [Piromyces finnis]|eukprot:ORX60227.1 hypothetical protein BCR36DRAFT_401720 [Piromyces finnis]